MNPRLFTPAIVLVSFGAAFGLTGWHAGLWRAATADAPATPVTAAVTASVTPAPPPPEVSPQPIVTRDADPMPEDNPPAVVPPQTQAAQTEGFLDARDRAADHGARSR
jgi:hypothetical protein